MKKRQSITDSEDGAKTRPTKFMHRVIFGCPMDDFLSMLVIGALAIGLYVFFIAPASEFGERRAREIERQQDMIKQSYTVSDFQWSSEPLSEEAAGGLINSVKGHRHVVYTSFTITTGDYPLRDPSFSTELRSQSGTVTETLLSDVSPVAVDAHATRRFERVRMGTSSLSRETASSTNLKVAAGWPQPNK